MARGTGPRGPLRRWRGAVPLVPAPPGSRLVLVPAVTGEVGEPRGERRGAGGPSRGILFEAGQDYGIELGGHLELGTMRGRRGSFVAMAFEDIHGVVRLEHPMPSHEPVADASECV